MGGGLSNKILITDKLFDSAPLFLTANTETVYAMATFDLQKEGAIVVEVPAGTGPGTLDDAYFRFVIDMGGPGPDKGKGGKYLILPPDYKGDLEGPIGGKEQDVAGQKYFVVRSPSYVNLLALRGLQEGGSTDAPNAMFKNGLKVYPLSQAANPPKMEFISVSGKPVNTIHANNYEFFGELNTVIQREPVAMWEPELLGQFAAIGIQKGKPFAPDARMKKTLTEAVAIGNATARSISFKPREEGIYLYPKSAWFAPIHGGSTEWLRDGGEGGRYQNARSLFYYQATLNTPAMVLKMPGVGSQYACAATDSKSNDLDGSKNYQLHIPPNVPAKNFWSIVVYDPQTRSELQTSQKFPSKNSQRADLAKNSDGSVDLYFGPKAPAGKETNWMQTVPGKSWFAYLRLYGPLDPWFDRTWKPGEFELVDGDRSKSQMLPSRPG